jgi:hypothetical protein
MRTEPLGAQSGCGTVDEFLLKATNAFDHFNCVDNYYKIIRRASVN